MPTSGKYDLPEFEKIKPSDEDLAEISTESMAQSVAAFMSLMKRYEEAITAAEFDIKRLYFILGEVFSAQLVIRRKFEKEKAEGRRPSMPYMETVKLGQYVERIQRQAVQKVANRYPYTSGPFIDQLKQWVQTLPDSKEKKEYLSQTLATKLNYETMMVSPGGIPLLIRDFINRSEIASEAFEALWQRHGSGAPPGLPPSGPHGSGSGEDGDIGRRLSTLESTVAAMTKDLHAMALGIATISESVKHLATKEDVAKLTAPPAGVPMHGFASKEDLTPIAADIAWIKERLKHVPTKFGLLMAVAVPVASGLWWLFQQIFSAAAG